MSELDSELDELRLSLREIYPGHSEQEINSVWSQLLQILDPFRVRGNKNEGILEPIWDSSSVVLITYPDSIYRKDESTLKTLTEFVKNRLSGLSSVIHVLPFLPSTSDGGFAVSDHGKIDETFGIHEDEHKPDVTIHLEKSWKYVPCNGTTPKCGRLE